MSYVYFMQVAGFKSATHQFVELIKEKTKEVCVINDVRERDGTADVVLSSYGVGNESLRYLMNECGSPSLLDDTKRLGITVEIYSNSVQNKTQEHLVVSKGKELDYQIAHFEYVHLDALFESCHTPEECEVCRPGSESRLMWYNSTYGSDYTVADIAFGDIWAGTLFKPQGIERSGLLMSDEQLFDCNDNRRKECGE